MANQYDRFDSSGRRMLKRRPWRNEGLAGAKTRFGVCLALFAAHRQPVSLPLVDSARRPFQSRTSTSRVPDRLTLGAYKEAAGAADGLVYQ
jgi:hypothetical protein